MRQEKKNDTYLKELKYLFDTIDDWSQNKKNKPTVILYYPKFVKIAGSRDAALLLNQILYWTRIMQKEFFKYKLPPSRYENETDNEYLNRMEKKQYKIGDSWCEELGFTEKAFNAAIELIAYKKHKDRKDKKKQKKEKQKTEIKEKKCISYREEWNKMYYKIENPLELARIIEIALCTSLTIKPRIIKKNEQ